MSKKHTPALVYLLIYAMPDGERQELFTSRKKANKRASDLLRVWMLKPGAQQTGSIRQGRVFAVVDGITYSIVISEITDPNTVELLWRLWNERQQ